MLMCSITAQAIARPSKVLVPRPISSRIKVKLGDEVDESKAVSSGAVSYYTIYLVTDETLTISPGKYFKVADRYYEFDNYDELWDEFIVFNSIK